MQRALDVSFLEVVTVQIGGKDYVLQAQSAVHLERILNAIYSTNEADLVEETAAEKKSPWGTVLAKTYTKSLPIIAMMFGYDPKSTDGKEVIKELEESMPPKLSVKIYEEWRRINEIDDFLLRTGKVFLDPELVARLKEAKLLERQTLLQAGIQEFTNEANEPAKAEEV